MLARGVQGAFNSRLDVSVPRVLRFAVLGPFFEELLFRGYLLRQLYRRAGWKFLPAIGITAAVFGLAHMASATGKGLDLGAALGQVAITGFGGALFGWLFLRCQDNLWVPFGLHGFMNLWSEVFGIDRETVLSGLGNAARVLCVLLAIVMTLLWTKRLNRGRGHVAAA